jgi:hypothetical protein
MIYGHAFGPATLPFELTDLVHWLIAQEGLSETKALQYLSELIGFTLPSSLLRLRESGLSSQSLAAEFYRGQQVVDQDRLLVGVELVQIPGVSELNTAQIEANLRAFKASGVEGLALSWDLWHMPLERLALVAQVWGID